MIAKVALKDALDARDAMNKTERQFAQLLELRKREGLVVAWVFEPMKFRLAPRTWYTPDFLVLTRDAVPTLYEVKAMWHWKNGAKRPGWKDDSRVKVKVVAELFPWFRWRAAVYDSKTDKWTYEHIN